MSILFCSWKRSAAVSLFLLLIACTDPVPVKKIGILYKEDNPAGESLVRAAKLVEHELELGQRTSRRSSFQIKFVFQNVGTTQESALAAFHKLVKKHQVSALVGPTSSQLAIPIAEVANNMQIPMISPASTHPATTTNKPYVFRVAFLDEAQAIALSKFVGTEVRPDKVAALFDVANSYSKGLVERFKEHQETNYQQRIELMTYLPGVKDFTPYFEKLKLKQIDLLLLPNFTADTKNQIDQLIDMNWNVTLLGSDSWWPAKLKLKLYQSKMYYSHHWDNIFEENNQESKSFSNQYFDLFRQQPTIVAALSFDAINILIEAINQSGGSTRSDVRGALVSIKDYKGVTGKFSFNETGNPEKAVYIFEIKDKEVILKSEIRNESW